MCNEKKKLYKLKIRKVILQFMSIWLDTDGEGLRKNLGEMKLERRDHKQKDMMMEYSKKGASRND